MKVKDQNYKNKTIDSFSRQSVMKMLSAKLMIHEPGAISISFPFQAEYTQQNGYIHAGIVTTILDSACGYAAFTLMPPNLDVLTVEFKVNLLRPAKGEEFTAKGKVLKAGKVISVVEGIVYSSDYGEGKPVASMTATIMAIDSSKEQ